MEATMRRPAMVTSDERKTILASQVALAVTHGARVESQSDYQAVLVRGRRVNHVLHFLIGLFTVGLWWVVWLLLAITGGEKRELLQVDPFGKVNRQRA